MSEFEYEYPHWQGTNVLQAAGSFHVLKRYSLGENQRQICLKFVNWPSLVITCGLVLSDCAGSKVVFFWIDAGGNLYAILPHIYVLPPYVSHQALSRGLSPKVVLLWQRLPGELFVCETSQRRTGQGILRLKRGVWSYQYLYQSAPQQRMQSYEYDYGSSSELAFFCVMLLDAESGRESIKSIPSANLLTSLPSSNSLTSNRKVTNSQSSANSTIQSRTIRHCPQVIPGCGNKSSTVCPGPTRCTGFSAFSGFCESFV